MGEVEDVLPADLRERLRVCEAQTDEARALLARQPGCAALQTALEELEETRRLTGELLHAAEAAAAAAGGGVVEVEWGEGLDLSKEGAATDAGSLLLEATVDVGRNCEALFEGAWAAAHVVGHDVEAARVLVRFLGFDDTFALPGDAVRPLPPPAQGALRQADVAPGMRVEALYRADGRWYDAVVLSAEPFGAVVTFTAYEGSRAETALEHLRGVAPASASAPVEPAPVAAPVAAPVVEPAEEEPRGPQIIAIPDNLKILPTDTEAERERKRKRVRAIKSKNRFARMELETNERKSGWQAFQNKAAKGKRKRGGGAALGATKKKESMFRTSEALGARVGVTGSGAGMTAVQERQRLKRR